MCGICGVINFDPQETVPEEILVAMRDAMRHRGPDDAGIHRQGQAGLAHRRLSIVDLAGGHQPMAYGDAAYWVTYNGEIYNFRQLRAELEAEGYPFATNCDTEVVLAAYAARSERCVERFRGMFAFGLWDVRRRRLLLARDRFGIKPLYYAITPRSLVFASEIKALLIHPDVPREVDSSALRQYFRMRYVPGPQTMFRTVRKLQPGHILIWEDGAVEERSYWDLPELGTRTTDGTAQDLRERLRESIRLRLMSDVPLGVFLSGGLDSSTVVALMAELVDEPIQTFSIGYPQGAPENEFEFARMVAERYQTRHRELVLDPGKFWDALPEVIHHFDEPVADPAAVPLYFLSKYAKQFVTVVLSGEGADELLGGYSIYRRMLAVERFRKLPGSTAVGALLRLALGRKAARYLEGVQKPLWQRYRGVSSVFTDSERTALLAPATCGQPIDEASRALGTAPSDHRDALLQMLYFDLKVWLPDDLLVKADKMSMAAGVELRVPFLDHELAEWTWRLPSNRKLHNGVGKQLLREAVRDLLPPTLISRPKFGFPVPIQKWFRTELFRRAREFFEDAGGPLAPYLDLREVHRLIEIHGRAEQDLSDEIFTLLVFGLWHRSFIEPRSLGSHAILA
jgi:asparagine synthase (glutamine-hydrolysing)